MVIRNTAYWNGSHAMIADLADALHNLPFYLPALSADDWRMVRFVVTDFRSKHPDHGWQLVRYLDGDLPEHF